MEKSSIGDDKVLMALSWVNFGMVQTFLLVNTIAVTSNPVSFYSFVLAFIEKSRGYETKWSWFCDVPANRRCTNVRHVVLVRTDIKW